MIAKNTVDFMLKYHTLIFISFVFLCAGFAYPAIKYFPATSLDIEAPKNSISAKSLPIIKSVYPNITAEEPFVLMVDDKDNKVYSKSNVICQDEQMIPLLRNFTDQIYAIVSQNQHLIAYYDYFRAQDEYKLAQSEFCMDESFIIEIMFGSDFGGMEIAPKYYTQFNKVFKQVFNGYSFLSLAQTDQSLLFAESNTGTTEDLLRLDTISISLGLLVVGLYLHSFALLIISIINLLITFIVGFAISYFFTFGMEIATYCPAIESSISVALTFDYCLFLFGKLQSELRNGRNAYEAIVSMTEYSGHVVLVSGGCLSLVCLFLCICQVEFIEAIGLSCAVIIVILMVVNVINTLALLMLFPKFFMKTEFPFNEYDIILKRKATVQADDDNLEYSEQMMEFEERKTGKISKLIHSCLKYVSAHLWIMILALVAILALSLSFLPTVLDMKYGMDMTNALPRNSNAVVGMKRLSEVTYPGITMPYYIVLNETIPGKPDTLIEKDVFDVTQSLINDLITNSSVYFPQRGLPELVLSNAQLMSPCYPGMNITVADVKVLNRTGSYRFLLNQTAPELNDLSTFAVLVISNISMTGKHSEVFIPWIRDIQRKYAGEYERLNITSSEYSLITTYIDTVTDLFESFPVIIAVSFSIMFLILGFAFESLLAPFCFLLEVGLAMVFFYGVATCLFENDHVLDDDGIYWCVIFIMFSISIGLCSDYYVFRFSGIYNEYNLNRNAKSSVLNASENMSIVMTAGMIMMISFSGLLLSQLDMLVQFGTCLVVLIGFDTLVVVPILVPCLTVFFGKAMFWPGEFWRRGEKEGSQKIGTDANSERQQLVQETENE